MRGPGRGRNSTAGSEGTAGRGGGPARWDGAEPAAAGTAWGCGWHRRLCPSRHEATRRRQRVREAHTHSAQPRVTASPTHAGKAQLGPSGTPPRRTARAAPILARQLCPPRSPRPRDSAIRGDTRGHPVVHSALTALVRSRTPPAPLHVTGCVSPYCPSGRGTWGYPATRGRAGVPAWGGPAAPGTLGGGHGRGMETRPW